MPRILKSKKRFLLGVAAALAVSVAAFAYWTTTGTGDGSATVGEDAGNIHVTGTVAALDTLAPGGDGRTVEFVADNPAEFNQSITTIELVSVSAEDANGDPIAGCGGANDTEAPITSDFSMEDVAVDPATDGDIERETTDQELDADGTLYMNNLDENQDDCKNASLSLVFATE